MRAPVNLLIDAVFLGAMGLHFKHTGLQYDTMTTSTKKRGLLVGVSVVAAGAALAFTFLPSSTPVTNETAAPNEMVPSATSGNSGEEPTTPPVSGDRQDPATGTNSGFVPPSPASTERQRTGWRRADDDVDRKAMAAERRERWAAERDARRNLAKSSPETLTAELSERFRLTESQQIEVASINARYAEQLVSLDNFEGSETELAAMQRQIDGEHFRALAPIIGQSPAFVERRQRFEAAAEAAGATRVTPQTQTNGD